MIKIGSKVKFCDSVFGTKSPYYPYYEAYLGFANFTVLSLRDEHVKLAHPSVTVDGLVHLSDLVLC